jgi:hypothetical protein
MDAYDAYEFAERQATEAAKSWRRPPRDKQVKAPAAAKAPAGDGG